MIDVTNGQTGWNGWSQELADEARDRYHARELRLDREKKDNDARLAQKAMAKLAAINTESPFSDDEKKEQERKRAIIAAAIARAAVTKSQP
jgi:electron transport complex protein RnfB